ncbi:MAG: zinc ribbon domain-containing protein [Ruminococcus sp.]|nr:zinc ribbon domain-containing protein [Ruminococcus sp.]
MLCPACGNDVLKETAKFCPSCGSLLGQQGGEVIPPQAQSYVQPQNMQYAPPPQELAQIGKAMHDYIKVDLEPKMSKVAIVVSVIVGLAISALSLIDMTFGFLFVGLLVMALLILIIWGVYKMNITASSRLKRFFSLDGEANVLMEFASAVPMANDQFRLSAHYIFVKTRCMVRILDVTKITRVKESTNFIPTGVRLDALVEDEHGPLNITLCRLHMTKSKSEADEYFNQITARQQAVVNEYNMQRR